MGWYCSTWSLSKMVPLLPSGKPTKLWRISRTTWTVFMYSWRWKKNKRLLRSPTASAIIQSARIPHKISLKMLTSKSSLRQRRQSLDSSSYNRLATMITIRTLSSRITSGILWTNTTSTKTCSRKAMNLRRSIRKTKQFKGLNAFVSAPTRSLLSTRPTGW